ncbi:ABC transporter ATP-binding protein [Candidatus Dojkabacteria bacterium]|uniref:ABC transporter ATP-binding protein n=1 Tax=Candidatus Dojkabacteria bacterium TaxID=2099670 RepID=A0A3M0Z0S1_9BACT|nr:MAG: ABC transporter ATP-binding protein [Candidatus Dojkabacteria bacterium]
MNNKEVAIKIRNLSKTFMIRENTKYTVKELVVSFFNQGRTKSYKVLDNINLDIYKGEFFGIIGGNGSGKSTLLKLIAGIYKPDDGSHIDYAGKLVPFLELGVGFNPDLTGRENIYLNGTILGMTLKFINTKIKDIIEFAEIGQYIDMPVKNYSSGMMVRLAFSIAIQSKADIYLLDEILSVGDARFQQKSIKIIYEFKRQGKTIVFVNHSMDAIRRLCDRVMLLKKGEYVVGKPDKIIKMYTN